MPSKLVFSCVVSVILWVRELYSVVSLRVRNHAFSCSPDKIIRYIYEGEVAQSSPTLCDPMDCSLPGSSIRGILQARILEWVAISFSRGSSQPRDWTQVSRIGGRCFNLWATRKAQIYPYPYPYSYLYLYPYLSILPGSKINHKYYISCCNTHCIWSVYLPRIHCFEVSISPCNKVRPSTQSCQPDLASLSF